MNWACSMDAPSSENIAVHIAETLAEKLSGSTNVRVRRVTTWESEDACATYYPDFTGRLKRHSLSPPFFQKGGVSRESMLSIFSEASSNTP